MSEEVKNWSRRGFVKTTALASVALQMPLWWSCVPEKTGKKELSTLQSILNIIFPNDKYGPGALDFAADRYILWWLEDERIDEEEKDFVRKHLDEIQEKNYNDWSSQEKEEQVNEWAQEGEYQNFLSKLLTLTFEAMVLHPEYGYNEDFKGVKWLEHQPGVPQPSKDLIYPQIFKTIQNG